MYDSDDDGVMDYPDEANDRGEGYVAPVDPIDGAVGGQGFVMRFRPEGCEERLVSGATRHPEEFDRFYFEPQVPDYQGLAPVLIDILQAENPTEQALERERKRCDFKAQWCLENGWRYVVLIEDECGSVGLVRQEILEQVGAVDRTEPEPESEGSTDATLETHTGDVTAVVSPEELARIAETQGASIDPPAPDAEPVVAPEPVATATPEPAKPSASKVQKPRQAVSQKPVGRAAAKK